MIHSLFIGFPALQFDKGLLHPGTERVGVIVSMLMMPH